MRAGLRLTVCFWLTGGVGFLECQRKRRRLAVFTHPGILLGPLFIVISAAVETFPPAKLNLFLELFGKRADGYHELDTVMVAIDRRDRLRVSHTSESGVRLRCRWSPSVAAWREQLSSAPAHVFELPPPEDNLVVRALSRFAETFGCDGGFDARLEKRIPAGAGMGGASSDAASALAAAARLCGVPLADPRIAQIAADLGSDVPFFLGLGDPAEGVEICEERGPAGRRYRSGMARATGRGERLTTVDASFGLHFVVIYPPEPLSTAAVYRQAKLPAEPIGSHNFLAALRGASRAGGENRFGGAGRPGITGHFFNRLSEPARQMSSWIDRSLDALAGVGLQGGMMTGSGSACFAVASSARSARRAASRLSSRRIGVCFATTPTSLPASIRLLT